MIYVIPDFLRTRDRFEKHDLKSQYDQSLIDMNTSPKTVDDVDTLDVYQSDYMGTPSALLVIRRHQGTWYGVYFNAQWKTKNALSGWYELLVIDEDELEIWSHGDVHVEMTLEEAHGIGIEDITPLDEAPEEFQKRMEEVKNLARL